MLTPQSTLLLALTILSLTPSTTALLPKLPKPVVLPKPAPKPAIPSPHLGQLVEPVLKGIEPALEGGEAILSLINPPKTTTSTVFKPTGTTPVRLSAWATAPAATAAATAAYCPRAQVYLNYCNTWYNNSWDDGNAAHCLCHGPSKISKDALIYIPELFDDDAEACVAGYQVNAKAYSSMAVAASAAGNKALYSAYSTEYSGATVKVEEWAAAATFCADNAPVQVAGAEGEGLTSVGKEYLLGTTMVAKLPSSVHPDNELGV